MNKQTKDKINLLLSSLMERYKENQLYFISMEVVFKSGTKEYKGEIIPYEGKLQFLFCGNKELMELDWLPLRIIHHGCGYDSMKLYYKERGCVYVLEADQKNVTMKSNETKEIIKKMGDVTHTGFYQQQGREYLVKIGQADSLLKEIGILSSDKKLKNDMIRKYNQIDHFVELIVPMLEDLCAKHETINIIDCGCGKSYLTFVLNYYIREVMKKNCYLIGLDRSEIVIDASKKMAQRLGYHNMGFFRSDIIDYKKDRAIHLLISLHACDTATDEAIAVGVMNHVEKMVMVPCCQSEIHNQYNYPPFVHILKHGVLKSKLADILTDGLRGLYLEALGYKVSMIEYISPLETPKNLMMRIEKAQGPSKELKTQFDKLVCSLGVQPSLEKYLANWEGHKK